MKTREELGLAVAAAAGVWRKEQPYSKTEEFGPPTQEEANLIAAIQRLVEAE